MRIGACDPYVNVMPDFTSTGNDETTDNSFKNMFPGINCRTLAYNDFDIPTISPLFFSSSFFFFFPRSLPLLPSSQCRIA